MNDPAPNVDVALDQAARRVGGRLMGARRYGLANKSAGSAIALPDGATFWLRVHFANPAAFHKAIWEGEVAAGRLAGVDKPVVYSHFDWFDQARLWRGLLTTLAPNGPASSTSELRAPIPLSDAWLSGLKSSLAALAGHATSRNFCLQNGIAHAVGDVFGGGIDLSVRRWVTCHGDLHWANVGWPRPVVFDWETWGRGPFGYDAATLLAHACLDAHCAGAVAAAFAEQLDAPDGRVAQLYACARIVRSIDAFGVPDSALREPVLALGRRTIAAMRDCQV